MAKHEPPHSHSERKPPSPAPPAEKEGDGREKVERSARVELNRKTCLGCGFTWTVASRIGRFPPLEGAPQEPRYAPASHDFNRRVERPAGDPIGSMSGGFSLSIGTVSTR